MFSEHNSTQRCSSSLSPPGHPLVKSQTFTEKQTSLDSQIDSAWDTHSSLQQNSKKQGGFRIVFEHFMCQKSLKIYLFPVEESREREPGAKLSEFGKVRSLSSEMITETHGMLEINLSDFFSILSFN